MFFFVLLSVNFQFLKLTFNQFNVLDIYHFNKMSSCYFRSGLLFAVHALSIQTELAHEEFQRNTVNKPVIPVTWTGKGGEVLSGKMVSEALERPLAVVLYTRTLYGIHKNYLYALLKKLSSKQLYRSCVYVVVVCLFNFVVAVCFFCYIFCWFVFNVFELCIINQCSLPSLIGIK